MPRTRSVSEIEVEVLEILKILPESKKAEVFVFLEFLGSRFRKNEKRGVQRSVSAVKSTWGSIKLNEKTLAVIAEDKELEYDV